ncbi:MAG TPA: hypothetical protein VHL77_03700 [Ferruginibacter sp.]|jgi:hypothetical protein|nr:hypothetical protein [Ferruginibacter sp.]
MKSISTLLIIFVLAVSSCDTAKRSYFTVDTRRRVEEIAIPVEKLQFYIDKDLELKRELAARDAKVTSGKVVIENGKYVNIVILKAGTQGVCTVARNNTLEIAFENGDNKNIRFGVPEKAGSTAVYSLFADEWMNRYSAYNPNVVQVGKIVYDGDVYYMRFSGERPKLMIQKTAKDKYQVNTRVMKGRKVD